MVTYNLLNSAFLELLEFIKHENIAPLLTFIVEKYDSVLELIDYVDTYKHFKARDRENKDTAASNRHKQTTLTECKWDREADMTQDPGKQQHGQDLTFDRNTVRMGEADSRQDGDDPLSVRSEGHSLKIAMLPRPCLNCGLVNYKDDSDEEDEPVSDLCHPARDKRCVGQVEVPVLDMGKKPRKDVEL